VKPKGNFQHLAAQFKEGCDFEIVTRRGNSDTLILAIHGGGIEPGTADIATRVAGEDHALYLFQGIRTKGNAALHLTSTRFDEPRALALAAAAQRILSIHGCRGKAAFALVGGRDREATGRLREALQAENFTIEAAEDGGMGGKHPTNICNRGLCKMGLQLELSAGLRYQLLGPLRANGFVTESAELERSCAVKTFCDAIRKAIS
jgi:phage replication-related protein YjqB (UPF0714/DUF867 family)